MEKPRNKHRRSGYIALRYDLSETIKLKYLLVLKDPWHGLNIEGCLIGARIKCFNSIMVESGNVINLILGSVDVVIGAREFFCLSCVRWVDGPTPDSTLSPGEIWGHWWALEDSIVSRIWTTSRWTFPELHAIVNCGSLECRPLGSVHISCEN
jgi:hypothetical protein